MQIRYTYRHMDSAPALQNYFDDKLLRLRKFDHSLIDAEVTFSVEKLEQKVEVSIKTRGAVFNADHVAQDMYTSCDLVLEKLERQLLKRKEKLKDHHH